MGCDGGTIPTRDELVKLKKKPEKRDKNAYLNARWNHCAISQQVLEKPIVACQKGRLYNRAAVIEMLLEPSSFESAAEFSHIKGLKDVVTLNLTDNSTYKDSADKGDTYKDFQLGRFICPITGLEMTGTYRFCYLVKCGCVFSERALKELQSATCNTCNTACEPDDVVVLNGTDEDLPLMCKRMLERKQLLKLKKKLEKAKKKKLEQEADEGGPSDAKKVKFAEKADEHLIPKVGKKMKLPTKSASANGSGSKVDNKKPKSIQEDPQASAAFKSLFTSSDKCKNQMKAHWVTHNPGYY